MVNKRFVMVAAGVGLAALTVAMVVGPRRSTATPGPGNGVAAADALPNQFTINAIVRDFKAKGEPGGHPDFQSFTGTGRYGLVMDRLDKDNKPVMKSLRGEQPTSEYKDRGGRPIPWFLFDASRGDVAGVFKAGDASNGFFSKESFDQWYRDVPGVNQSRLLPLVLNRAPNTNRYVFDSAVDEPYRSRGGFFPINGELLGNYGATGKNFHFTTEFSARFVFERGTGQVFTFTGDDDVWVFIDGRMVIDLGGLHSKKEQVLDLDRLTWLEDGKTYPLKIFHAERRTTQSNFRIETNLKLAPAELPPVADPFD